MNSCRCDFSLSIGEFFERISVSTSLPLPFYHGEVENDVIGRWVIRLALSVIFVRVQFSNRLSLPPIISFAPQQRQIGHRYEPKCGSFLKMSTFR